MLLLLLAAPLVLFIIYRLTNWTRHYLAARQFDLPIIPIPIAFDDVWWLPLRPLFSWVQHLPLGLGSWYVYTEMGWPIVDENRTSLRLGENFVLCSPNGNTIVSCYMPTINQIFMDHKNWGMPPAQSQLFAVYGQNVSSTHGEEWKRHRKITAGAFTEGAMEGVWEESKRRVRGTEFGSGALSLDGVRNTFNVVAMHVLANVAFGQDTELETVGQGHRDSLMGCLGTILQNILLTLVFSSVPGPEWMLPRTLRRLKAAVAEFRLYMEEFILRDMQSGKAGSVGKKKSLLSAMVQANEAEKHGMVKAGGRPSFLTESELYGNLFVFNLAGYETTASTFTFALSYLALHPEVQAWILEELDAHYDPASPYAETYPKLVRCLAVMYETLRLAGPAPLLVRQPVDTPQEVEVLSRHGPKTVVVPPETLIGGHFYGGHLSPKWGSDALEFNPKRFIDTAASGGETLAVPDDRMYMPWIFGPRVCPGKKFSQVEFVGIVAQLLMDHRIEVDCRAGESESDARGRLRGVLAEKYFNVSAYVKHPHAAGVRLVRRSKSG
ncbi:Secologanin synthase [Cyphellophora attinorum]|uniref:Secologanin synthase n=1 Tax=Cyphellophora attinorum TaxID=1664694 RepID=A0A0N1H6P1_9EURO|nr:Secologanin synthase [Phialophora attinorum]KPI37075.1 Secologanin synthase [Phialophora attinorum]